DIPPVLAVRATPKMVQGFWKSIGRAAVATQGVLLPPSTHAKSSFAAMRLYCGDAEVTPIHPFKIERRLDSSTGIYEGLYVFALDAIGPQCGAGGVRLLLFSEKSPDKGDTRIV